MVMVPLPLTMTLLVSLMFVNVFLTSADNCQVLTKLL